MLLDFFLKKLDTMHISFLPPNFHIVADAVLLFCCLHLCIQLLSLVLYMDFKPREAELSFWLYSTQHNELSA